MCSFAGFLLCFVPKSDGKGGFVLERSKKYLIFFYSYDIILSCKKYNQYGDNERKK